MVDQANDKGARPPPKEEDRHLLIVEDDHAFRQQLARAMERRGFTVTAVATVAESVAALAQQPPAYALVDLRLEDGYGLDIVPALRERREDMRIVVLTGYGNITSAVAAVKAGAVDYLAKPADDDDI